jgi:hypothetical protein
MYLKNAGVLPGLVAVPTAKNHTCKVRHFTSTILNSVLFAKLGEED